MDNFDPYNVLLVIATNIPVLLMTGFVLQGHIWSVLLVWVSFGGEINCLAKIHVGNADYVVSVLNSAC